MTPIGSLAFAVRVWLATILALFVAFWLELEAPSTAAVTVAILAEPTRGQALDKAVFRSVATILGVIASIVVTGLFPQSRDLMLAATSVWLGLCVFAAKLLDGYRAYAAVLSGYTLAIIATEQIDNPQHVFDAGMARGAAIAVGIMSIAVVNALMSAPDRHPWLAAQLTAIHRRVRDYASARLRDDRRNTETFLALVREIMALRPQIDSIALESSSGIVRSGAARSAAVRLVAELQMARILSTPPTHSDVSACEQTSTRDNWIDRGKLHIQLPAWLVDPRSPANKAATRTTAWHVRELTRRDELAREDILALRSIRLPSQLWRAPLYRSYQTAAESGLRAAIWFALAATFYVGAGWPAASVSLALVAVIAGLGATTPNSKQFTTAALVAAPIVVILTGILEFIVLDGADDFPRLAIALAPFSIGAALLTTSQNSVWVALGRINLVAIPIVLAPTNPQSYDPQAFLFTSLFLTSAATVLLLAQMLIPPEADSKQRMRLLAEARDDLRELTFETAEPLEEATFREASRIGQFLSAGGEQDSRSLAELLSCFDQSAMVRLCHAKLTQLCDGPPALLANQARDALEAGNTADLRAIAHRLYEYASHQKSIEAAVYLAQTSDIMDHFSDARLSQGAT
ncbi:FUSC family protein [Bradyrhizobium sp. DASA03120]|uniref:FUSC family protein n=1 Tax=Bradyrhizobium sp. SMVTL-02 TaxID=3395917 RepID=UPI003F718DA8